MTDILVGRKAISAYLGVSWDTVKKWVREREFPLLQESGCQPILNVDAIKSWEVKRRKELKP